MKQIYIEKDNSSDEFLYEQLYNNLKDQIIAGDIRKGEKCPSIRNMASMLDVSVTTVMQAYNQLLAEGYIKNKPGSGYYVENIITGTELERNDIEKLEPDSDEFSATDSDYMYDTESFDFVRWKKCASKVYTEYAESLFYGSDIKGEYALRKEISKYLFKSRGVSTDAENIIIAAGTQQTVFHLGRILKKTGITLLAVEKPGYSPVKSMFIDAGFATADIPVTDMGINIENLPVNITSVAYVNPSNQFPTGVVMPIGKRYEILKWADENDSYIIEDDYNSELRYFGKPLPTIKSLDNSDRVIYLGSFSSTLFPAIKISYMVLPKRLTEIFNDTKKNYSQTCSKAEQLTLAYYMSQGYYYTSIRKKRALYTKKLKIVIDAFEKYGQEEIKLSNANSGLFVTIKIDSKGDARDFIEAANKLKVYTSYIEEISTEKEKWLSLYYSYIPLESIDLVLNILINRWRTI